MLVADGSFLPTNVFLEVIETVRQSSIHYLDDLEQEMSELPKYQPPVPKEIQKRTLQSRIDSDCRYINQKKNLSLSIKNLALNGGYNVGLVHRGLALSEIDGYAAIRVYQNNALKKGFKYNPKKTCFYASRVKNWYLNEVVRIIIDYIHAKEKSVLVARK